MIEKMMVQLVRKAWESFIRSPLLGSPHVFKEPCQILSLVLMQMEVLLRRSNWNKPAGHRWDRVEIKPSQRPVDYIQWNIYVFVIFRAGLFTWVIFFRAAYSTACKTTRQCYTYFASRKNVYFCSLLPFRILLRKLRKVFCRNHEDLKWLECT